MHVRFRRHGDGLDPAPAKTAVGEISVGPRGLLRLLESDLGIVAATAHPSEEVALYRECLAECDDLSRFYHASFGVDPVGVARVLLDWRKTWYLHGWDGTFKGDVAPRLMDMAAVEALAQERVPACVGQRLRRALELLQEQRTQIETLTLDDHADDLPPMWQRLAEHLGADAAPSPVPAAQPQSDLGKLQALLTRNEPAPMRQDGSLIVVHALSRDVTAQAVAELVRGQQDRGQTVVIASRDGIVLDNALERVGLPRVGFQHYSPFRAASQVLKLALALVWAPLDPHRLLQFLIHPVSPLKWDVRAQLAEAVASEPGIGGPAWQQALANVDASREEIAFWVTPERFPTQGASIETLRERARRCAAWLGRRLSAIEDHEAISVYRAAYAQARAFVSAIDRLVAAGRQQIAKIETDRLIDEATRSLPDESAFAEAGHVPATNDPGSVSQPVDQVIWWDIAPARLDLTPTFSSTEQRHLAAAGVHLPTPKARIAAATRAWHKPVLNCRERLVLVVHDQDQGRHPLWGRIAEQLPDCLQVGLDDALLHGDQDAVAPLRLALPPLARRPLPPKKRWWRLEQPIPRREVESYSSLSKAYYHPHEWVLNYHARLRGSRMAGVADGPLLFGSLAHRLFERFFNENENWRDLTDAAIRRWLDAVLVELIEKEGAVLLEYGRGVDRQRVVTTLEKSLFQLLAHLRQAGVTTVQAEHPVEHALAGGKLHGHVDLLLTTEGGARAVLDAKWGSEPFRLREIEQGRHLQLAIYGFMLSENDWPSPGYYIVTAGNVLAPDADFFPNARRASGAESAETVWRKSLVTRDWRLEQFQRGAIEVNAGAEPDDDSEPPAEALETRVEPNRFDDFVWLTGFDPSQ